MAAFPLEVAASRRGELATQSALRKLAKGELAGRGDLGGALAGEEGQSHPDYRKEASHRRRDGEKGTIMTSSGGGHLEQDKDDPGPAVRSGFPGGKGGGERTQRPNC